MSLFHHSLRVVVRALIGLVGVVCCLVGVPLLGQPPALEADHVIISTPMQNGVPGTTTTIYNHLSRDSQGRTSYTDGSMVTINDPVARLTTVYDNSTLTYAVTAWPAIGTSNPASIPFTSTQQTLMSNSTDLGTVTISGWPSTGTGFTVSAGNAGNGFPDQQVQVWSANDVALPMYVEVSDPNSGTTSEQFSNVQLVEPSSSKFVVPPGFTQNPSLSKSFVTPASTKKCRVFTTPNPLILVSFFPFLGSGVATAIPNINRNCVLTNFAILLGPFTGADVLVANPLLLQVEFFDLGLVPPFFPWVDTSLLLATASNGTSFGVGSDVVILTIFN